MNEHKSIHEAINAVMNEVGYVKKSKSGGLNYSFAGESALIAAIRPSMVEHGIYMSVANIRELKRETYPTKSGTIMNNTIITGVVRFAHVSGSEILVESIGEGSDVGDKSANKALTGLYKYALRQTFCIETGDDPDKYASEERVQIPEISDELWNRWTELCNEASKHALPFPELDRNTITKEKLIEYGKDIRGAVDDAVEKQNKAGE